MTIAIRLSNANFFRKRSGRLNMKFRARIDRQISRRRVKRFSLQPAVELFDPKVLLDAGFVQGFATNNSGAVLKGATVELLNTDNTTVVMQTTTDSTGYYAFNNVTPGTYDVKEIAAGYAAALTNTDIRTTINPAQCTCRLEQHRVSDHRGRTEVRSHSRWESIWTRGILR